MGFGCVFLEVNTFVPAEFSFSPERFSLEKISIICSWTRAPSRNYCKHVQSPITDRESIPNLDGGAHSVWIRVHLWQKVVTKHVSAICGRTELGAHFRERVGFWPRAKIYPPSRDTPSFLKNACPTENGKTSPLSNLTEFKIKTFEKLVFHAVSDESRLFTWGELLFYLS